MVGHGQAKQRSSRRAWITRAGMLAVAVAVVLAVPRLIGEVDWAAVRDAVEKLSWWQAVLLALVVVPRQVAKAQPKAFCIDGVTTLKALVADLGTLLMLAVTPPPTYMALRLAMFGSWGVGLAVGTAGSMLATAIFQIVRFSAPLFGFILLLWTRDPLSYWWLEGVFVLAASAGAVVLWQIMRSDSLARVIGRTAGRFARRFRRSVEPRRWAEACLQFRADVAGPFRTGFWPSVLSLWAMLFLDLTVLVLCLRFVGLPVGTLPLVAIGAAYFFAFPFTFLPYDGLGVVDVMILAALVQAGGYAVEAPAIAALMAWRVFTVFQPIAMGLIAVAAWRHTIAAEPSP